MACSRRSLTSTFSHLSRRFHPSLSHILHDDCDRGWPPRPPPPPPPPQIPSRLSAPNLCSPFHRGPGLRLPLGIDFSAHRLYSSSSEFNSESEIVKDVADVLTDPSINTSASGPDFLTDASIDAAVSAVPVAASFPGEVAAAAADSFYPVAALQYLIDGVHSFTGVHWWAAIALTTVLIRGATIPLLLNQMRATMKLNMMRPELEELKQDMQNSMDPESIKEGQKRMNALFKKHGVTPFTPLKGLFIQGPIFISFFLAISNMVEKVPSFKVGGALWFTDLTTPDPLYILPVLTSLSFLATVELNMQEGMEGNPMVNTMKNFSRLLALFTIPFTAHFPKAIFCYWITSNLCSLLYGFVLRRPPVRAFLNLPAIEMQPSNPTPPTNFSFFGESKPTAPTSPASPAVEAELVKTRFRRSSVISQRLRNLEKSVKARSKAEKQ